jgi:hypothetical protein
MRTGGVTVLVLALNSSIALASADPQCSDGFRIVRIQPASDGKARLELDGVEYWVSDPIARIDGGMIKSARIYRYGVQAPPEARLPPQLFWVTFQLQPNGMDLIKHGVSQTPGDGYLVECATRVFAGALATDFKEVHIEVGVSSADAEAFARMFTKEVRTP